MLLVMFVKLLTPPPPPLLFFKWKLMMLQIVLMRRAITFVNKQIYKFNLTGDKTGKKDQNIWLGSVSNLQHRSNHNAYQYTGVKCPKRSQILFMQYKNAISCALVGHDEDRCVAFTARTFWDYLASLHGPLFIMQEVLNVRWELSYGDTANVIQWKLMVIKPHFLMWLWGWAPEAQSLSLLSLQISIYHA